MSGSLTDLLSNIQTRKDTDVVKCYKALKNIQLNVCYFHFYKKIIMKN